MADLSFGEYVRLIETKSNWDKLKIKADRATFVKEIDGIREIRNDVMHFDTDEFELEQLKKLLNFSKFLTEIERLSYQKEGQSARVTES